MKLMKGIAIILALIILFLFVYVKIQLSKAEDRLKRTYDLGTNLIPFPSDSASMARGKHLAQVLCTDCHGYKFEGKLFLNEPDLALVAAGNLTSGKGGIGAEYTDQDWIRSVRRGVGRNGLPLFLMPSKNFANLCDSDFGSLIAYLKSIAPVDKEHPAPVYTTFGKFLLGTGAFGEEIISAELVEHNKDPEPCKELDSDEELGKYLVNIGGCKSCHGAELNGSTSPDPNAPFASNLTGAGNLGNWDLQDFIRTMRSGVTPEGKSLNNKYMPWKAVANFDDYELKGLHSYLLSVEELPEPQHD